MIVYSIYGICTKLDDDGGVPLTTYEANVYTAIFNGDIEDSRGNRIRNTVSAQIDRFFVMNQQGMSDNALNECLYQIFDMIETLTEQLDTDTLTDSTYEALGYTAILLKMVENCEGNILGNGATYYFRPGGNYDQAHLVDLLYMILDSLETITEQLDADGTVTDTDYEALWYTAIVLMKVENSVGNVLGNDPTWAP